MTAIDQLQSFIDQRWAACQPTLYPDVAQPPQVPPDVTHPEAEYFLAAVAAGRPEPPLFEIDADRHMRSDRLPPKQTGAASVFNFFEHPGTLRLETIAHMSAMARLRDEFGWPREHLIFESAPLIGGDRTKLLSAGALDILTLDEPCRRPNATMDPTTARCRVGVEAKARRGEAI